MQLRHKGTCRKTLSNVKFNDHIRLVAISGAVCAAAANNVTYNVFASPTCERTGRFGPTLMEPQAQEVGHCQNHGVGKGAYNSIEVLGCTDRCLCFKQVAAMDGDANCDTSKAVGWNVKMSAASPSASWTAMA